MKKHWKGILAFIMLIIGVVFVRGPRVPFISTDAPDDGTNDSHRNIMRRRKIAETQYT